jgi:outer membrane receptor for monomeric catechols
MDAGQVKATFTNGQISVSAILTFDEEGKLVNFLSFDRFETSDGKIYINNPWETPVTEYRKIGDYFLPAKADVIYKRTDGDFCYLEFRLEEIKYNVKNLVP